MTRDEAKVKIAQTKNNLQQLTAKEEATEDIEQKIDLISKIVKANLYLDVLESFVAFDNEEYSKIKSSLQRYYQEQLQENKNIVSSLKKGESIKVTVHTYTILHNYKKIISKIKIHNKAVSLVA